MRLWGIAQAFLTDVKDGRSLFIGKWFKLKCFIGGWCCFPGGGIPLNSSTVFFYFLFLELDHCRAVEVFNLAVMLKLLTQFNLASIVVHFYCFCCCC